ncbi:SGNH/GDSL hydrolase family protein [Clostridium perfringens]
MAIINDKLNEILNAIFGKDIRQALHDGLNAINRETESTTARQNVLEETFNALTIDAGNSNAEVVAARVDQKGNSYETLGKRLGEIDTQLSEKMNIGDSISIEQLDKNKKKIDETYLSDELIEKIAGNAPISSIIANGSVTRDKLANFIKPDFLENIKYEQNILDKSKFEVGGLDAYGELNSSVTFNYCSDFIPVIGNAIYYRLIKKKALVAFYDINKNFISRPTLQQDEDIITTENAAYMKYTELKEDMLNNVISSKEVNQYTEYGERYVLGDKYKVRKLSESIKYNDLSKEVFSNKNFLDNIDLNTITDKKNYVCLNTVKNKPGGITGTFFLVVEPYMDGGNDKDIIRWIIQTAIDFTDVTRVYRRILDVNNTDNSVWKKNYNEPVFTQNVYLDNIDLNTITDKKNYVCLNTVRNKPGGIAGTFLLNVEPFVDSSNIKRWIIQTATDLFNVKNTHYRILDINNPNNSIWEKMCNETIIDTNKHVSKLNGKTWAFFGDSITEGVGTNKPDEESYPAQIGKKYGINVINYGIAGASWQKDGNYDEISILTQIENANLSNVDLCTIFAGTNDFGRGALPIGNVNDEIENTMHGAINNAVRMLIEKKQDIKIGIITPMWRQRFSNGDNKDSDFNDLNGKYLRDYVNAVIEGAKYNHIPVLNLYDNCGINKFNYKTFLADGLHPNKKGYEEILAEKIYNFGLSIF